MITAYRWESNWKILALVIFIVPLLLRLGFWQLQRADEKIQLQAAYDHQQSLPAASFDQFQGLKNHAVTGTAGIHSELNQEPLLSSRRVLLRGKYDNQQMILLDNQIVQGKAGYDVISPFITYKGALVLINRGWIAGFADRNTLPKIGSVNNVVEVEASIYIPLGKAITLAPDEWPEGWPLVVQWLNIPRIADRLAQDVFPYVLRIEDGHSGVLHRHWLPINTQPEKHWGYAVQWFLMALSLTIFWLYTSIKPK